MAGRRRLRDEAPRLLGKHDGMPGKWYREAWLALVGEMGPFTPLQRLEAGRVAVLWVQVRTTTEALQAAHRQRREGKGRRPSPREIERLSRRQGLADASYSQALERLKELTAATPRKPMPADVVARLRAGARP